MPKKGATKGAVKGTDATAKKSKSKAPTAPAAGAPAAASGGTGGGVAHLTAPAAAKKTASTAKAAKMTVVQWDGNTSLTISDLLHLLCDDGGALFGRGIACHLLLKELLCFGCVNKAFSKILRENLCTLLLFCRDVIQDPGELRKVGMRKLCEDLYLTAYIFCEYLYLISLRLMITPYSQIAFITLK